LCLLAFSFSSLFTTNTRFFTKKTTYLSYFSRLRRYLRRFTVLHVSSPCGKGGVAKWRAHHHGVAVTRTTVTCLRAYVTVTSACGPEVTTDDSFIVVVVVSMSWCHGLCHHVISCNYLCCLRPRVVVFIITIVVVRRRYHQCCRHS
jgi:hypothetical protein